MMLPKQVCSSTACTVDYCVGLVLVEDSGTLGCTDVGNMLCLMLCSHP